MILSHHPTLLACSLTSMAALTELGPLSLVVSGGLAIIFYWISIALYRITLHPLAQVPGPKLAAVSLLFQTYYSTRNGQSRFYKQVELLHKQYGTYCLSSDTCPLFFCKPQCQNGRLVIDLYLFRPSRTHCTERSFTK